MIGKILKKNIPKIFCIANNKTANTSLEGFFKYQGFFVAQQRELEVLLDHYINKNWNPIIYLCKKYRLIQEVPFTNKFMPTILLHGFPKNKFIFITRDYPEQ